MLIDKYKISRSSLVLALGFIITAICLVIFGAIAEDVLDNEILSFDTVVINWFHSFQNLDSIMFWITQSGSVESISVFSLLTIYYLQRYKKGLIDISFFILTVGGGALLNYVLKLSFHRSRPSINDFIDAVGFSFPSGHAMGSMIFYGAVSYFILRSQRNKRMKFIFTLLSIAFILMIGISRIYLNAHYPSDVIAGYLAGFSWLSFCIFSRNLYEKRISKD